jgi:hypothetical protein
MSGPSSSGGPRSPPTSVDDVVLNATFETARVEFSCVAAVEEIVIGVESIDTGIRVIGDAATEADLERGSLALPT